MDIETIIDIDAPADAAWEILGERFGAIADGVDAIEASSLSGPLEQGATRTCTIAGFGGMGPMDLHEELKVELMFPTDAVGEAFFRRAWVAEG